MKNALYIAVIILYFAFNCGGKYYQTRHHAQEITETIVQMTEIDAEN